eukprot:TRINITY_DN30777_c0_g1_i1.p1 TRINITY_DN30777_c0_g1~~TRINITY_DN30777_c0_g1_i1.p1  ORF type:complete len:109 (-),score=6.13 TRINITY_DN30777_c0_g1_i1:81-407(-)
MIRRPPKSTLSSSSAASDVYKRQLLGTPTTMAPPSISVCFGELLLLLLLLSGTSGVLAKTPDIVFISMSVFCRLGVVVVEPNISPSSCLLYTSPSPRDRTRYRMPSSA